jgi:hypothetical protein
MQGVTGADCTYVKVAYNSREKTLASHDFNDLPDTVRARLADAIGGHVFAADQALLLV